MRRGLLGLLFFAFPLAALAQGVPEVVTVTSACGTTPTAYTDGQNRTSLQDTDGRQCVETTISGTVPLPSGAATAANQTAVTGSAGAGTAAASALLTGGIYNSGGITLTDTQQGALQLDASGNLLTAATISGTIASNVTQLGGNAINLGSGTVGTGTLRAVLATDVALPAGTNNIGDVDVLSVPAPLSTTGGGTEAAALRVTIANDSTGLVTVDGTVTADPATAVTPVVSTAAEACHVLKASAGELHSLTATITTASGYVLVHNATSAPGDGAVTPLWWYYVQSNGTAGALAAAFEVPYTFDTGITVCFSTSGPFTKTASATASFSAIVE